MRLDKFLANMQIGSRKEVKVLIKKGMVQVNNKIIKSDKFHVNESEDIVLFDGERVFYQKYVYLLLNKPAGVISATVDNFDETVVDLLTDEDFRDDLFPVGRLDKDTEGFLLLTNDGALSHRLLSPKKHVEKEYFAKVDGIMNNEDVVTFASRMTIDGDEICLPAELKILSIDENSQTSEITLILHEGKFHQVKRMIAAVGKEVTYLKRIRMGNLELDSALSLGKYRPLTEEELILIEGK